VESLAGLVVKMIVIGAVVVWFFSVLSQYRGIPTVLILLGLILVGYGYFTSSTVMGRHIYAIGGNEKAALLSGVKTNKMLFLAYVNMALLAAVAGLVFAARPTLVPPRGRALNGRHRLLLHRGPALRRHRTVGHLIAPDHGRANNHVHHGIDSNTHSGEGRCFWPVAFDVCQEKPKLPSLNAAKGQGAPKPLTPPK
jgi:hypothetical protein